MTETSRVQAVVLDVGGVLLVPSAAPVERAVAQFGIRVDAPTAERAHYHGVAALDAAPDDLDQERQAYVAAYADVISAPVEQREAVLRCMRQLWNGPTLDLWSQPVSTALDGLKRLAQLDAKLAIVSNSDGSVEEQLRRSQICQIGEGLGVPVLAIVDSHLVRVAKPAAAIFRHALDPIGVEPERALYVGDTVRYDVAGARAAGLRPVHMDPFELCPMRDDHDHVRSLSEVAALATGQP
jgi:putative hydrolase of the HAD superfamily